jgi:DNA modification methylase
MQMIDDYQHVKDLPTTSSKVSIGDARTSYPEYSDFIFTSPPYPNDMEYIHQTRLELHLMGFVDKAKDLTKLKKQMISSSVKLVYKENEIQKTNGLKYEGVRNVCSDLDKTLEGKNWGWNASDMTAQFFGGMAQVIQNWSAHLAPNGTAAVVIGDSAFNGIKVSTDTLLAEVAKKNGFVCDGIEVFRSRWNTKHDIELRESVVLLRKVAN